MKASIRNNPRPPAFTFVIRPRESFVRSTALQNMRMACTIDGWCLSFSLWFSFCQSQVCVLVRSAMADEPRTCAHLIRVVIQVALLPIRNKLTGRHIFHTTLVESLFCTRKIDCSVLGVQCTHRQQTCSAVCLTDLKLLLLCWMSSLNSLKTDEGRAGVSSLCANAIQHKLRKIRITFPAS